MVVVFTGLGCLENISNTREPSRIFYYSTTLNFGVLLLVEIDHATR